MQTRIIDALQHIIYIQAPGISEMRTHSMNQIIAGYSLVALATAAKFIWGLNPLVPSFLGAYIIILGNTAYYNNEMDFRNNNVYGNLVSNIVFLQMNLYIPYIVGTGLGIYASSFVTSTMAIVSIHTAVNTLAMVGMYHIYFQLFKEQENLVSPQACFAIAMGGLICSAINMLISNLLCADTAVIMAGTMIVISTLLTSKDVRGFCNDEMGAKYF